MKIKIILILTLLSFIFYEKKDNYYLNLSPSMPRGVYKKINKSAFLLEKEDLVVVKIPETAKKIIYERGYLPQRIDTLLKIVKATEEDDIEIKDQKVYINGNYLKDIRSFDTLGRELPQLTTENFEDNKNKIFLFGTGKNSFDSSYFGLVNKNQVVCIVEKVFVVD